MRSNIRGGAWKNSEDEVLKAAVMKYGQHNWQRCASLLARKTARQCKARWYEWIDPSIRKGEWSKDEEEKLLHLVKVFPSQWRTLAPLIGRTAHQCIQRYEELLDAAHGLPEHEALRGVREGEIDPAPEVHPPLLDAIDQDEDEIQMLEEARARLANTRGKKAKRKAREKQLEGAKRLAELQKNRELRAAGVTSPPMRGRRRAKDIFDYAVDIPFKTLVPGGPLVVPAGESKRASRAVMNKSLQDIEGVRRDREKRVLDSQDARRLKRLKDTDLPSAVKLIEEMGKKHREKYKDLILPGLELGEGDLMDLVRVGRKRAAPETGTAEDEESRRKVFKIHEEDVESSADVQSGPLDELMAWKGMAVDDIMKGPVEAEIREKLCSVVTDLRQRVRILEQKYEVQTKGYVSKIESTNRDIQEDFETSRDLEGKQRVLSEMIQWESDAMDKYLEDLVSSVGYKV